MFFISDLGVAVEDILNKFTYDTKLRGAVDTLKGGKALQRSLYKLWCWAITNKV